MHGQTNFKQIYASVSSYYNVHTSVVRPLLGAKLLLASCLSVCQHASTRVPRNRLAGNLIIGTFMKRCHETPNLFKIEQKYRVL